MAVTSWAEVKIGERVLFSVPLPLTKKRFDQLRAMLDLWEEDIVQPEPESAPDTDFVP
jgi:hypothetical protein